MRGLLHDKSRQPLAHLHHRQTEEELDDDGVHDVDEEGPDQGYDKEGLEGVAILAGDGVHVGDGDGSGSHAEAAESGGDHGGIVVAAHDPEDDLVRKDGDDGNLNAEDQEDDAGPVDFISLLRRLEILDLLYENLNETSLRDEQLDAGAYMSQIAAKLVAKSPQAGVRINISTEPAMVPLDVAVRMGVVLAELVDASLSSSFKGLDSGHLEVTLQNRGDAVELAVYDDGHGTPTASEWLSSGDLTLRVVRKLLSYMNATIEAPDADHGREIRVVVPITSRTENE